MKNRVLKIAATRTAAIFLPYFLENKKFRFIIKFEKTNYLD
ncbi:hypothetical protein HMPREF3189_01522 [Clostridiales bacterium KA00134]|nr:hypothetical protein HMPREF3189_01522 [Clostridiales bacterium KA00134]